MTLTKDAGMHEGSSVCGSIKERHGCDCGCESGLNVDLNVLIDFLDTRKTDRVLNSFIISFPEFIIP